MRTGSLTLLALVTAAAVALAVGLTVTRTTGAADADRGEPFLPGLVERINEVTALEIATAETAITLRRDGDRFIDDIGYPARTSAIRDLLTGLSVLVVEEAKTDRPDRYAELSLAEPKAEEGASRHVRVLAGDRVVADVYIGKAEPFVGGTRGGVYARRADEPRAWLLRGAVDLPGVRAGWYANRLLELKPDEIAGATLRNASGEVSLVRAEGAPGLTLADPPEGREADPTRTRRITGMLDGLAFADLRKAGDADPDGAVLTVTTTDGLTVRIAQVGELTAEKGRWVRIDVQGGEGEAGERVAALRQRTAGYEFLLRGTDADALGLKREDFLEL